MRATRPDKTPLVNQTIRVRIAKGTLYGFEKNRDNKWTPYYTDSNGYVGLNLNVSDDVNSVRIDVSHITINGNPSMTLVRLLSTTVSN